MAASNGMEFFSGDLEAQMDNNFPRLSNFEYAYDEEELMWAAIQRLPSQKRRNFALLNRAPASQTAAGREITEAVDVRKLDRATRELVVKQALATSEQDNYKLLAAIKDRLDRVGLGVPKVEVRYQDVTIGADVQIGSRALPTLINCVRDTLESMLRGIRVFRPKRHKLTILNNISGVIKPGRMTLLLGPPGSGKTTLLKALAGKLETDTSLKKSGIITYNGQRLDSFCVQRTSAYISQTDNHIAELTVRETLDYAARFQGADQSLGEYMKDLTYLEKERKIHPNRHIDAFMKASSVSSGKHTVCTDYILKVLGLDICSDTLVGNEMLRGVSGGQRKRVTTSFPLSFAFSLSVFSMSKGLLLLPCL